jgi:hypothetical protein
MSNKIFQTKQLWNELESLSKDIETNQKCIDFFISKNKSNSERIIEIIAEIQVIGEELHLSEYENLKENE